MPSARVPPDFAYRTVRRLIADLLTRFPDHAETAVPSCPEWTVRDLVAHLADNCAGMIGEERTPSDADLPGLLTAWDACATRVEHLAATGALEIGRLLMDAFTHELDLRETLGVAAEEAHPAYAPAFDVVVGGLTASIMARNLPALRLVGDGTSWVAGLGRPAATVSAGRYDLFRSMTGRRTTARIAELEWSADPAPWLPAFFWGPFQPPVSPGRSR